jgi:hypothetical protein
MCFFKTGSTCLSSCRGGKMCTRQSPWESCVIGYVEQFVELGEVLEIKANEIHVKAKP